jgi:hypothetical protein
MADKVTVNTQVVRAKFAVADQAATATPPSLPYRPAPTAYTAAGLALIESTLTGLRAQVHAAVSANAVERETRLAALEGTEAANASMLNM